MADDKDTDSGPEKDAPESDAAARSPRTDGDSPTSPDLEYDETDDTDTVGDTGSDEEYDEDEDGEDDKDRELVGVGARKSREEDADSETESSDTVAKSGPRKKDRPTPKQKSGEQKPKRTTPISFVKGSVGELKKVVYPTGSQLANYFVVVLVFVMLVIGIVTGLDYGFGWLMLKVFG